MSVRLRTDDLTWQELDDEVVVLDLRSSTYFVVNGSGATLWPLLAEDATVGQLASALTQRFGLADDVAMRDVNEFVDDLATQGLLDG